MITIADPKPKISITVMLRLSARALIRSRAAKRKLNRGITVIGDTVNTEFENIDEMLAYLLDKYSCRVGFLQ